MILQLNLLWGLLIFYIMDRIKRVINKNYTTISNVALRDKNLSLKAKGFLTYIFSLTDDWDFTIQGISGLLKESKGAIYSVIEELREGGYCDVVRQKDEKGRFVGTTYSFIEYPESKVEQQSCPHPENPHMDNPDMESPHMDNWSQRSTKEKELLNQTNILCEEFVKLYHDTLPMLSKINKITNARRNKIVSRIREMDNGLETAKEVLNRISLSPFLLGINERKWTVDFDWIISNDTNWVKVMEGKYDDKKKLSQEKAIIYNSPQNTSQSDFEEI